ncbi:MAG: DUF4003 domain-containing protein [Oscillospiraceae bacterium]|nr:DUF4003 domain-containing protein [Oscillospiraceae bacterium]
MEEALQKRCNLFIENRDAIKAAFKWNYSYIYPLCAWLYTAKDMKADVDIMRNSLDLLKENTSVFSNFRGISRMATVTMLSLSDNPKEKLDRTLDVYNKLKELFWGSEYLVVTATMIADLAEPGEYEEMAKNTRTLYNHMKEVHPFLTSSEDSTFAALLVLSGLDTGYLEDEMEKCYQILKPGFFFKNAVQSLSQVLALGDSSAEQKCKKTLELFEYLKSHNYKYGTEYELATLGVLALLDVDIETLAKGIMEADDFLKEQKGFGALGIGAKQRLMYAGMLTMCDYIPSVQTMKSAALIGVVSLIIAQQVAIMICIVAASTAASAASSH